MKKLLLVLATLMCASALAQPASAQPASTPPYPNRPIKFIVPFPPGGNLDFIARTIQPRPASISWSCATRAAARR